MKYSEKECLQWLDDHGGCILRRRGSYDCGYAAAVTYDHMSKPFPTAYEAINDLICQIGNKQKQEERNKALKPYTDYADQLIKRHK